VSVGSERAALEDALGYHFQQLTWLDQALTHSSYRAEMASGEDAFDNEKLEFLGDAVLGMMASEFLVETFPDWEEGRLSKGRAALVNSSSLSAAGSRLGLGDYLRLGKGEEKTGGRWKPALLADAYEAVIAAIYLDGGFGATREFVRRTLLAPAVEELAGTLARQDNKSALQEFLQRRGRPGAEYRVTDEIGPDHRKFFVVEVAVDGQVIASGAGASKKEAEQAAAQAALSQLGREKTGET